MNKSNLAVSVVIVKEKLETQRKGIFCVCICACHFVMTMPCVRRDASSVISVALIQRERDGELTEIEQGWRWVWGGACQRRFALCCTVGRREGDSDKLSSHFVFTQLVFVCKMPVALFSASRNTLFDPVVAGACTNLCSAPTVERLIYYYNTTCKLSHHVETYLEPVIRKGS